MSTTHLPFSIGVGGGEALTVAKGITAMGVEEAGAGVAWVEGDGFVSSSLRFLSGFAEAPWFDGGTRLS